MVSKSSRTVINVVQKLEHTVQPVDHATVKTTQEHHGNPNCARANDLTGIPKVQVVGVFHTNSFLFCFSLRISLHVAQLVPLSV